MIKLLNNILVFREGAWRPTEILIADRRIARVADRIPCSLEGLEIIDGQGMKAIPGYLDQHVHITGGGGEGGFSNQVPPLRFSAPVKAGITTLVGLLGTDGTTRSVESLVAKTKALRENGLTAFCLTGAYEYPSPTVTGSVRRDIVLIEECIGVKIAICDHRSASITRDELARLASDAHQAGILSGKPGIVHLHTGSGPDRLDLIFDVLAHSNIPISVFRPTHVAGKLEDALRFAQMGGYIDITCSAENPDKRAGLILDAVSRAPRGLVTISTDGNGSMPVWNEKNEMIGIGAGSVASLHENILAMVRRGAPLEEAILPATENPARALKLYPRKGALLEGSDADILLLDGAGRIDTVFALGRMLLRGGEMQVHCNFEDY